VFEAIVVYKKNNFSFCSGFKTDASAFTVILNFLSVHSIAQPRRFAIANRSF